MATRGVTKSGGLERCCSWHGRRTVTIPFAARLQQKVCGTCFVSRDPSKSQICVPGVANNVPSRCQRLLGYLRISVKRSRRKRSGFRWALVGSRPSQTETSVFVETFRGGEGGGSSTVTAVLPGIGAAVIRLDSGREQSGGKLRKGIISFARTLTP